MDQSQERSFIMIKPDGVQRGLIGEIISRFEKKGFKMVALSMVTPSRALIEEHYDEHKGQWYFDPLVNFTLSGPVVAMVWEGHNVIKTGRKMIGATNPDNSEPGSVRFDMARDIRQRIIHGSDTKESAEREIELWLKSGIVNWKHQCEELIYE